MTSLHVSGFWFHITWNNDQEGYDQHGTEWRNRDNPICMNKNVIIACKEARIGIEALILINKS